MAHPSTAGDLPRLQVSALKALDRVQFRQEKPFGNPKIGNNLLEKIENGDGKLTVLCKTCWMNKACRIHGGGRNSQYRSLSNAALPRLIAGDGEGVAGELVFNLHNYSRLLGE